MTRYIAKHGHHFFDGICAKCGCAMGVVFLGLAPDCVAKTGGPAPTPPIMQKIADILPSKQTWSDKQREQGRNIARAADRLNDRNVRLSRVPSMNRTGSIRVPLGVLPIAGDASPSPAAGSGALIPEPAPDPGAGTGSCCPRHAPPKLPAFEV